LVSSISLVSLLHCSERVVDVKEIVGEGEPLVAEVHSFNESVVTEDDDDLVVAKEPSVHESVAVNSVGKDAEGTIAEEPIYQNPMGWTEDSQSH